MIDAVMSKVPTAPVAGKYMLANIAKFAVLSVLLLMFTVFALIDSNVATLPNIINILQQASFLALFAAAQAIVLTVRGFDLALGPTVSLVSVVTALMLVTTAGSTWGIPLSLAVGMAAGLAVGAMNGYFVSVVGINPFVVTLATMNIVITLATTISSGFPVSGLPNAFSSIAFSDVFGIPVPIILVALTLAGLHFVQRYTVFGRALYLIGSSPRASHVAGIRVRLHTWCAYILCSGVIAFGAILLTSRTGSGEPNLGGNLTLQAIAAAVMGGVSLRGGQSDMLAPILGALFLAVLSNGMDSIQVNGFIQQICLGALIILGLAIDRLRRR